MKAVVYIVLLSFFTGCFDKKEKVSDRGMATAEHEEMFLKTMQNHLEAVSDRDLTKLENTLSPDGKVQFILPNREITSKTKDFLDYHREWFRDTTWTLESEILDTEIGKKIGIAITEVVYREPGKSYANRMTVSYGLKNINGDWYVFKDHASSVEISEEK